MKMINIGFSNMVSLDKIVAVISPESSPIKRMIGEAKEKGVLVDASCGKKTKSAIICQSAHVVLSALSPSVLENRIKGFEDKEDNGEL